MEPHHLYVMNEEGVEVRGAHPSKTAKGEAAKIVVGQRWASPPEGRVGKSYTLPLFCTYHLITDEVAPDHRTHPKHTSSPLKTSLPR